MNNPISRTTRGYYESVLAHYTRAKSEFLTAYEILQGESQDISTRRTNALAALSDPDHLVRRAASRLLLDHCDALEDHVSVLIARLREYDSEVILNLCAILASLGGKAIQAIDALNRHVSGRNAELRMAAQKTVVAIIDDFGKGLCAGLVGKVAGRRR
jgi:hypothetical protein